MEKDLRDAYAALKLLRADLVKTRRDKRALEASLTHLQTHGPPPNVAQSRERRESQQMQFEDASSQLWRLAAKYERRLSEMEHNFEDNNGQKKEQMPEKGQDNQQEDEEENEMAGVEKLALLNKLHSLTATVEQQTQTMLAQQATFALQRGELETALEETQHNLQEEERKVADAVLEHQAAQEKFEFLDARVEVLKEEKVQLETKLATHAQTSSILKQQLEEKEEELVKKEREQEERELKLQLEHAQKMDELVEQLSAKFRQENEVKEKELQDKHEQEVVELHRKNGLLELELSSEKEKTLQDQEKTQDRYAMTLHDLQSSCAELRTELAAAKNRQDAQVEEYEAKIVEAEEQYTTTLQGLESRLEEAQKQVDATETEAKKREKKLTDALKALQDQVVDREQQAMMLCDVEANLTALQSQLAASEAKLAEEAKNHEEQLVGRQIDQKRHDTTVCDLENKLKDAQLQLEDSETKRLAIVEEYEEKFAENSQLVAQHEKSTRILTMEKKALQQELREARQTSKLTIEEFLNCQSVMEQKTQEHLQYLNRAQEQCESLEAQLLSAEDRREQSSSSKPADDSYSLKAFHGLSDDEIAALPPSKAWGLLRSGVSEMNGFLAHLQALLGNVDDVFTLCASHAVILPALCERLQGKTTNEKEQQSVLSVALSLLRFAVALKVHIKREEGAVTPKIVQTFRRRVFDSLAQWYECDSSGSDQEGHGSMPTPTFTITSRETALILQNWTCDRTKQVGVRRWLARMEAYPGVPPLRGASSNRVLELPPEGCTLELEDMTPEVKDAFLLLLIPILKQNRALHVRVFTRYTGVRDAASKQQRQRDLGGDDDSHENAEKVWAMRIHVQSAIIKHTRSIGGTRPSPLKLTPSPRGPPSPLAPTSPASSVSSSTSSTASSRLQIIQERLQYLHNNA